MTPMTERSPSALYAGYNGYGGNTGYSGTGDYTAYSAGLPDAARRVERMERRARSAVESNNSYIDTHRNVSAGAGTVSDQYNIQTGGDYLHDTNNAGDPANIARNASAPHAKAPSQPINAEIGEQLFLALLIFLLIREKSDPCLIAALIYLML